MLHPSPPMPGFVKLYASILNSSVWGESPTTRIVWITMLTLANELGAVESSVSGLARAANVSLAQCRSALEALQSPDPDSKSPEHEGRRITPVAGGWCILNYPKYRALRSPKQARAAERQQRWRDHHRPAEDTPKSVTSQGESVTERHVTPDNAPDVDVDVDVETTSTNNLSDSAGLSAGSDPIAAELENAAEAGSDAEVVLTHYLTTHPLRRRSAKGVAAIRRALKSGYSAAELCEAIDGNAADVWHAERHKHELTYVLRDGEHIDTFRQKAHAAREPLVDPDTGLPTERAVRILTGSA